MPDGGHGETEAYWPAYAYSTGPDMSQVITFTQPRTLRIDQVEDAALQAQQVRVRTLYSGISAGTELSAYRGSNVYLHKRWDPGTRLFVPTDAPSQPYPLVGWGYEE